uniref:Uncharacterized protein n=1 Tax=Panagrolaimus superbus TaxID=310955 RepID=A0A914Y402_9BILA
MANYEDGLVISDFDERYLPDNEIQLVPTLIERLKSHEQIVARNSRQVSRDSTKINDEVARLHRQLQTEAAELNQQVDTITAKLDQHETTIREAKADINDLRGNANIDQANIQEEK